MFSATFPDSVQELVGTYMHDHIFLTAVNVGGINPDVIQEFHEVTGDSEKNNKLKEVLTDVGAAKTIVFVESQFMADYIAAYCCHGACNVAQTFAADYSSA